MDAKKLFQERTDMFDNVYNFRHNTRIPLGCNVWSWQVLDCGYKQSQPLMDYAIAEKINREFHERYQFDCYTNLITRNPMRITDMLGGGVHWIDENDERIESMDHGCMNDDEYYEYTSAPDKFYWTKAFPRYLTCRDRNFRLDMETLKKAVKEWADFGAYSNKMLDMNFNEFGALMYYAQFVQPGFEHIFTNMRGIRGSSLDLRKRKSELKECLEMLWETSVKPSLDAALKMDSTGYIAPITMVFLAHSVLNKKQFEEYYYCHLKRIIDAAVKNNKRIYIFCEADILRLAEFFEDIPKGTLMIHLEQDDPIEFRKRLPNIAIAGGMPTSLLYGGTKQQCIDYAKHLIDELGDGFVLCQNKMVAFANDCTRENLLAVNDFVRNYQY